MVQISSNGPDVWTGGSFGPEAGLLGFFANLLGILLIIIWVYLRNRRKLAINSNIANYRSN
jgi:hypothetical protein